MYLFVILEKWSHDSGSAIFPGLLLHKRIEMSHCQSKGGMVAKFGTSTAEIDSIWSRSHFLLILGTSLSLCKTNSIVLNYKKQDSKSFEVLDHEIIY